MSWWSFLSLVHLVGLALGAGAASVKLALLLRCNADYAFVPVYLQVARPITRFIVLGLVLLTLSGIGWAVAGLAYSPLLVAKLVLVVVLWVLGFSLDKAVEPRFARLAPAPGEPPTPAFLLVHRRYLALEASATGLFYVITVMGVLL
jgi:hypothetical protein